MEKNCAICLDGSHNGNYNEKIINSKDFILRTQCEAYYFTCDCNISVHRSCVTDWVIQKKKCPICLLQVYKHEGCISISCLNTSIMLIGYLLISYGVFLLLFVDTSELRSSI